MCRFQCSGSHENSSVNHRFMLMDRSTPAEDPRPAGQDAFYENHLQPVIDVLEYAHGYEYIHTHASVKASRLLHCFSKDNENKLYLPEFGLAYRYTQNGKHKEYKEDLRKAHDGTTRLTSPNVHIGALSRSGHVELLGYNLLLWLCCRLPWEDNLKNPEYASEEKNVLTENIPPADEKMLPTGGHFMQHHRVPAGRGLHDI
ncbi:hypothetical protein MTO96_040090 [Rhipicephalus appendiculatus]